MRHYEAESAKQKAVGPACPAPFPGLLRVGCLGGCQGAAYVTVPVVCVCEDVGRCGDSGDSSPG